MKVVLLKEVKNLGHAGEVKEVSEGYARNYLIPNKLAEMTNKHNIRVIEAQKQKRIRLKKEADRSRVKLAKRINGHEFKFIVKCDEKGTLYAGLDGRTISAELKQQGFDVSVQEIKLLAPIKKIGEYEIELKIGAERAMIKLDVKSEK